MAGPAHRRGAGIPEEERLDAAYERSHRGRQPHRAMTIYHFTCQQCGLVAAMTRQQSQATGALTCPACAKAGIASPLLPSCGMECATNGTCGCAVPGFS
jgi:hypothetical protein